MSKQIQKLAEHARSIIDELVDEVEKRDELNHQAVLDYQREFNMLRDALQGWYDACKINVTMEGPVVISVDRTKWQKLFKDTCAALEETE
jgi:hypothetical protein